MIEKKAHTIYLSFFMKIYRTFALEIKNNRHEAKKTYTPFTNYRSYGCATGFNGRFSNMR